MMVTQLYMVNGFSVVDHEEFANVRILDGASAGQVVHLVAVLLAVKENDQGAITDIVGTHIVDTHSVASRHPTTLLTQILCLVHKGRRHQVRCCNDGVRDTRIELGLLQNIITRSVETNERDLLTVTFCDLSCSKERDLHEMFHLVLLAGSEEGGKDIGPVLHVRKTAEDSLDSSHSVVVVLLTSPIKINHLCSLCLEHISNLLPEALLALQAISLPDANTDRLVPGLKQTQGNTVSNNTSSTRNENSSDFWIKGELSQSWDHIGHGLSGLLKETHCLSVVLQVLVEKLL
mmetsp:Transcript_38131/g.56754  ORF Transcript_38131/g.56754 Transcript_38131/m.56754 type:complete len:290 (+) Transcript_38131:1358-2227(+)